MSEAASDRPSAKSDETPVVTRFAPSPTGALHIGGARTALFNWLFARGRGGRFLLRIEDTDRARSTPENTQLILDGLSWLGLDWDGEPVSQFARAARHAEVAREMLARGLAYKCFATQEEIEAFREQARAEGRSTLYRSPWRDVPEAEHPADRPFVLRIRAPQEGAMTVEDAVQGPVTVGYDQLDDMVLLRADGTPLYMLAVVVDDHDAGVTHVIRGDDHLTNTFRQKLIYDAMGWPAPVFAHVPLIFGPDGKKLSKRHGATATAEYRQMGYLAAGMRNYLTRLGWAHGDMEVFTSEEAMRVFSLDGINRAPARFDFKRLEFLSGQHMQMEPEESLLREVAAFQRATGAPPVDPERLRAALPVVRARAKTIPQLLEQAHFALADRPLDIAPEALKSLDPVSRGILRDLTPHLHNATWERGILEGIVSAAAESNGTSLGKLAGPLRAALAGRAVAPSVFDMMLVLGREETLARLRESLERQG